MTPPDAPPEPNSTKSIPLSDGHICNGEKFRPYSTLVCSMCKPSTQYKPQPEPGEKPEAEGAPVPFGRAHEWLRTALEYGAAFARLEAHIEGRRVRASAPSPKDAAALVDRVIAECLANGGRAGEAGAMKP